MLPYGALTEERGEWKTPRIVLLPRKLKYCIIDKDNKKTVCLGSSDLEFISYQISYDALIKRNQVTKLLNYMERFHPSKTV